MKYQKVKNIPFKISSKNKIKYFGINLTKEVKDLYAENYKTLIKGIKDDKKKWEFPLWHWGLRIQHCLCSGLGCSWSMGLIPGPVQWVKELVLSQLWHSLQLWLGFDPWPGNFHILRVWPKTPPPEQKKTPKWFKEMEIYPIFFDWKNI